MRELLRNLPHSAARVRMSGAAGAVAHTAQSAVRRSQLLSLYRALLKNCRVFPSIKRDVLYEDIRAGTRVTLRLRAEADCLDAAARRRLRNAGRGASAAVASRTAAGGPLPPIPPALTRPTPAQSSGNISI